MIHGGSSLLPLLEFALGVEIAQIIIVMVALTAALIFQTLFRFSKKEWVLIISSVALGLILPLLIKNWIF